jgi:DNA-binding XRE family transcriptional regulator
MTETIRRKDRLFLLRELHDLSRDEIANMIGISRHAYAGWETRGGCSSGPGASNLAALYSCTTSYIDHGKPPLNGGFWLYHLPNPGVRLHQKMKRFALYFPVFCRENQITNCVMTQSGLTRFCLFAKNDLDYKFGMLFENAPDDLALFLEGHICCRTVIKDGLILKKDSLLLACSTLSDDLLENESINMTILDLALKNTLGLQTHPK